MSYVTHEMRLWKSGLEARSRAVADEAMALYWRTHERLLTPSDKAKIRALYTRASKIVERAGAHEFVQRGAIPFEVRDLERARFELYEAKREHGLHTRRALNSIVAAMNAVAQFARRTGARDQTGPRRRARGQGKS